jgi:hypothetical protein
MSERYRPNAAPPPWPPPGAVVRTRGAAYEPVPTWEAFDWKAQHEETKRRRAAERAARRKGNA